MSDQASIVAKRMGERASDFLAALAPDQRKRASFAFADEAKRTSWFYTPTPHDGLALRDMGPGQRRLALQLVASGLSRAGFVAASTIMGLEATLDAIEGWRQKVGTRDPGGYHVSVFDVPSEREPWGWRFEGHHISLNYTIVGGRLVSPTPAFFGANPGEAPLGTRAFLRPLAPVEDLARDLIHLLPDERRSLAVISDKAPIDIMMANRPRVIAGALPIPADVMMGKPLTDGVRQKIAKVEAELGFTAEHAEKLRYTTSPKGLCAARMNAAEREALVVVLHAYIERMPDEIAEIERAQLVSHGIEHLYFAWAGGIERRQPHYYRIQGTRVLVEYDNSQNGANHAHSVWRDPANDFGADLLAHHYAHAHGR